MINEYEINPKKWILIGILVVLALIFAVWTGVKGFVQLDSEEYRIVVNKYGKATTNNDIVAPDSRYRGIQKELLTGQGYHFINPFTTEIIRGPMEGKPLQVPDGKIAILTRLNGKPIPPDQVLALNDGEKGILENVYKPGRLYYNPYEYTHKFYLPGQENPSDFADVVIIPPGYRGVVTRLVGKNPENPNVFVVKEGERGTQPTLIKEGTYPEFSHPFVYRVVPVDVRSRQCQLKGEDAVRLTSSDGFDDIKMEVAIEWAPILEVLPQTFVKFYDDSDPASKASGGMSDLEKEMIVPNVRSLMRMAGSRFKGDSFITENIEATTQPAGDSEKNLYVVQYEVAQLITELGKKQGFGVKSFRITKTIPSPALQEQFARRELAARRIEQYKKEIETEVGSAAVLISTQPSEIPVSGRLAQAIEQQRKHREEELGKVRLEIAQTVRNAERDAAVRITEAEKTLEVAKLQLVAAKDRAASTRAEGVAKAEVVIMKNKASAEGIKQNISAFGNGDKYAEYLLIKKFTPSVSQILSNTEGPFADFFLRMMDPKNNELKGDKHE